MLEAGEKVHIITRRSFEDDLRRHFVGEVESVGGDVARVRGFAFVHNTSRNEFVRRPERRVRVFSLTDAANIVNVIPRSVDIEKVVYRVVDGRLVVTDGASFQLDINEFGTMR